MGISTGKEFAILIQQSSVWLDSAPLQCKDACDYRVMDSRLPGSKFLGFAVFFKLGILYTKAILQGEGGWGVEGI